MKLPHTGSILLVEQHDILDENTVEAYYTVKSDHPILKDHFPRMAIWPGVYLIEGMCQTAGLHAMSQVAGTTPATPMITTVDKAKFRRAVLPGQTIKYVATRAYSRRKHVFYDCLVYNNEQKVAEATVGLTAR